MLLTSGKELPLAPQALSELSPQVQPSYYYPDAMGMELERQFALYGAIYKSSPWVRTVIDKRASSLARLPVNCWNVNGDTRTIDRTSGYAKLLQDPCEYLDPYTFWFWIQSTIDIYGEAYAAIVKDENGKPTSLLPMHPSRVMVHRDPDSGRYEYMFTSGAGPFGTLITFKQEDVVPFRLYNPLHVERGLSRMESLKSTIFAEDSSRNATDAMWKNAGRPNLVLTSEKKLNDDGRKRLITAFNQQHAGSSNAGKTLLLEDGVEVNAVQLTAVEMQFIEGRKLNQVEVCAVYDIAPTVVGILDHGTYSNVTEQLRGFYRDTMAVPIQLIESAMDKYVGCHWTTRNQMQFSLDDILRGDYEKRSQSVQHQVTSGVLTPNEGREAMGYSRFDDPKADKLYANSALQPLGDPAEQIRIQGQMDGVTPDGIRVTPMTTPVPSLDQSKPASVNALPRGNSASSNQSSQPGGPQPNQLPSPAKPKHLRAIKGEMGRGRSLTEIAAFAKALAEKNPDDLQDILLAVRMAIQEQKDKQTS